METLKERSESDRKLGGPSQEQLVSCRGFLRGDHDRGQILRGKEVGGRGKERSAEWVGVVSGLCKNISNDVSKKGKTDGVQIRGF